jgi:regulator of RNase E activity RraA
MADDDWVKPFASLDTSTISDALDRLGIATQVPDVWPLTFGFRLCGRAYTLLYEPTDGRGGTVGDYIDDVPPGTILVLDNAGRTDCTVWGDLLTSMAHRRGVGGTVIDGVCRDVSRSVELEYPVFSRGRWMRTGKDRVRLAASGGVVSLGGVSVSAGDLIVGDGDGVVVIPWAEAERVFEASNEVDRAEAAIREAIETGLRLDEARRHVGYHSLQTPGEKRP